VTTGWVGICQPPLLSRKIRLPSGLLFFYHNSSGGWGRRNRAKTPFIDFSPPPKMRQTRKDEAKPLHNHEGRRSRRPPSEPEPQSGNERRTHHSRSPLNDVQKAEAHGASFSQFRLKSCEKERFRQLVKNKPRVIRKFGCSLSGNLLCESLIYSAF